MFLCCWHVKNIIIKPKYNRTSKKRHRTKKNKTRSGSYFPKGGGGREPALQEALDHTFVSPQILLYKTFNIKLLSKIYMQHLQGIYAPFSCREPWHFYVTVMFPNVVVFNTHVVLLEWENFRSSVHHSLLLSVCRLHIVQIQPHVRGMTQVLLLRVIWCKP